MNFPPIQLWIKGPMNDPKEWERVKGREGEEEGGSVRALQQKERDRLFWQSSNTLRLSDFSQWVSLSHCLLEWALFWYISLKIPLNKSPNSFVLNSNQQKDRSSEPHISHLQWVSRSLSCQCIPKWGCGIPFFINNGLECLLWARILRS